MLNDGCFTALNNHIKTEVMEIKNDRSGAERCDGGKVMDIVDKLSIGGPAKDHLRRLIRKCFDGNMCKPEDLPRFCIPANRETDSDLFLSDAIDEAAAEITRLRAALAMSDRPCAYCSLPADEWAKCPHGFPGCARGDDAMGCPHLGASLEVLNLKAEIERLRAMVRNAYNDGFSEGMREHTTRRGGVPWSDCKYRAMIAVKDE